jgi:hypothetical protein
MDVLAVIYVPSCDPALPNRTTLSTALIQSVSVAPGALAHGPFLL